MHEVQASTPTGTEIKQTVNVDAKESGSLRTMTFPFSQMTTPKPRMTTDSKATTAPRIVAEARPSSVGRMIAASVAVILLAALAVTAYFVLRGPRPTTALTDQTGPQPDRELADAQKQLADIQKQLADLQHKEQEMSEAEKERIEAEKKRLEAEKKKLESEQKAEQTRPEEPAKATSTETPLTQPPPTEAKETPAKETPSTSAADPNTCIAVYVTGPDGQPVPGVRIVCAEGGNISSPGSQSGLTNPGGRWSGCGLAPGSSVKVVVLGGRRPLEARSVTVSPGSNFVPIQLAMLPRREMQAEPGSEVGGESARPIRPGRRFPLRKP
jgi:hypothetical protein